MAAGLTGLATSLSLLLAIGAQNAFVLRQGLLQTHVLWVCLFCSVSDAILIAAGIGGFGAVTAAAPWLPVALGLGGAAFLFAYGAGRFLSAWRGGQALAAAGAGGTLSATLGTAAAMTWLNPHVWLDTLGLIGAVSTQYEVPAERRTFALGAIAASFAFFFTLGYGARFLAPLMASPRAWRRLDLGIGVLMWGIAATLAAKLWRGA
jgi:L-lysine exporter family protein LysE/ArgO